MEDFNFVANQLASHNVREAHAVLKRRLYGKIAAEVLHLNSLTTDCLSPLNNLSHITITFFFQIVLDSSFRKMMNSCSYF